MSDIQTIPRTCGLFPRRLSDIGAWPDPLYCQGTWATSRPTVAIVGARAASRWAMEEASQLAYDLSQNGISIVSGGALGIDTAAHSGALAGAGHTVAVLAGGLDQYYPARNARLFSAILASGGAITSPFAVGHKPLRRNFVRRNKIIAGLADVVIVVEAGQGSGSLHTAGFATAIDRPLAVFAGSPGCESLLARGVSHVSGGADVMDLLNGVHRTQQLALPALGTEAGKVFHACGQTPMSIGEIAQKTQLGQRETQRMLLRLELQGLVLASAGQQYQRAQHERKS